MKNSTTLFAQAIINVLHSMGMSKGEQTKFMQKLAQEFDKLAKYELEKDLP